MPVEAVILIAIVVAVASYFVLRHRRRLEAASWPARGVVVPYDVLDAGSSPDAILAALEKSAAPLALEYFPVNEAELTKYRTAPINTTMQQSLVEVVKAVNPNSATLFKVILPAGEKLVGAVGSPGMFRGWVHNGAHISAQALLRELDRHDRHPSSAIPHRINRSRTQPNHQQTLSSAISTSS